MDCLCEVRCDNYLSHVVVVEKNKHNATFNVGWLSFTGLSHDELTQNWLLPIHPDDIDNCESKWKKALTDHTSRQFDLRVLRHDGEFRWLLADLIPINHEGSPGISATFIDITERKNAELKNLTTLEHFMCYWQEDPLGLCNFSARALARIGYRNLPDFYFAFGASYFAFKDIPSRIDFLYDHYQDWIGGEKGRLIAEMVEIKPQDNIICLHDKSGRHGKVRAMLIRDVLDGYPYFSIRYFTKSKDRLSGYLSQHWNQKQSGHPTFRKVAAKVTEPEEHIYEIEYEFWNFRKPEEILEGVIVYPEAHGFFDLPETKSIADLISLASNGVGFKC